MDFSRELREKVLSGQITVSFRRWSRAKVKPGGRYRVADGQIEVDSVELVPFSSIDSDDLRRSGETDLESLRQRAAHSGPIRDDTLLFRIEFHAVEQGEPPDKGPAGCLDGRMGTEEEAPRVVSASREIEAASGRIFELIADPARQPEWDGNDNLASAAAGQRVRRAGDVFTMTLTNGGIRENHVVEFDEGRRIAWTPAEPGRRPPGHLWRWELEPAGASGTRVTGTYDWTRLTDKNRLPTARATTAERLRASLDRLADLAEET